MDTYNYFLGILSTSFDNSMNPVYEYMQGTSMASPHVSGLAALVLSMAIQNGITLTNQELRSILVENTFDNALFIPQLGSNDPVGYDEYTGFGVINAIGAILDPRVGVSEEDASDFFPSQQLPEFSTSFLGNTVTFHFSAPLEKTATIQFVDPSGRMLLITYLPPGKASYSVPFNGSKGVYFLRVTVEEGTSRTKKVFFIE